MVNVCCTFDSKHVAIRWMDSFGVSKATAASCGASSKLFRVASSLMSPSLSVFSCLIKLGTSMSAVIDAIFKLNGRLR